MPEFARKQSQPQKREPEEIQELDARPPANKQLDLTDDLLEEIDGVLEEHAAEFVANYIQKGGQ